MQKIKLDYTTLGIINKLERLERRIKARKINNTYRKQMFLKKGIREFYDVTPKLMKGKMIEIIERMEKRLDVVIVRMMLAKSIRESRKLIRHGKVIMNGEMTRIRNERVYEGDRIEIKGGEEFKITPMIRRMYSVPKYLVVNHKMKSGIKIREARAEDINLPLKWNNIIRIR